MKFRVADLSDEVRRIDFAEPAASLNEQLARGSTATDQSFEGELVVGGELYRTGTDVHFRGDLSGTVLCSCSRCLEEFRWIVERPFRFVLVKTGAETDDDVGCDHYEGEEVDVAPLVLEQALLGLESATVCADSCRGLCSGCGANLNHEECSCSGSRH